MSTSEDRKTTSRRTLLRQSALALAGAGLYGVAPFYGPWKHNHAWAQAAQKKPLVIGLTMDASGQYAASGGEERLGAHERGACHVKPVRHLAAVVCKRVGQPLAEPQLAGGDVAPASPALGPAGLGPFDDVRHGVRSCIATLTATASGLPPPMLQCKI